MKKTLLLIAFMLCCAMTIFAQNDKISYQAVVRDTANRLVANKSVEVTVNIYNGNATTAAYTETQTVTTNLNGLISLQIGPSGNNTGWNSIQWNKARIETTVKMNGTQLGMLAMPLTAVPYAMYAKEINPDAALVKDLMQTDTALANRIVADSNSLVAFKGKMHEDSLALVGQITTLSNNVDNKTGALSDRITADSNNLVNFKNKVHGDSLALAGQITTLSNNVDNKTGALSNRITADSINLVNFKNKVHGDSLALGTLIDAKADADNVYTKDVTNQLLASKANTTDIKDSPVTITVNSNVTAGSFTLNQSSNATINIVETDPTVPAWAKESTKPTYDYNDIQNTPTNLAYTDANNIFTGSNNFTGNTNTFTGTVTVPNAVTNLKTTTASTNAVNVNDLLAVLDSLTTRMNILHDSIVNVWQSMPTMGQQDSVIAENHHPSPETVFTLAETVNTNCIYRMYINGVMVGGSHNGVLVPVANEGNKVKYDSTKNGDYMLKAKDKVTIVYWY